jgi:hypothetical protein
MSGYPQPQQPLLLLASLFDSNSLGAVTEKSAVARKK